MSLAEEGFCVIRSHVWMSRARASGDLYSEVQCIVGNGQMGHTQVKTLHSRNFANTAGIQTTWWYFKKTLWTKQKQPWIRQASERKYGISTYRFMSTTYPWTKVQDWKIRFNRSIRAFWAFWSPPKEMPRRSWFQTRTLPFHGFYGGNFYMRWNFIWCNYVQLARFFCYANLFERILVFYVMILRGLVI